MPRSEWLDMAFLMLFKARYTAAYDIAKQCTAFV
jgi:hypothetical protein